MEVITLAEARRLRGVSQEKMAEHLGISLSGYRKKETGLSRVYLDEAMRICDLLKFNMSEISFGPDVAENRTNSETDATA